MNVIQEPALLGGQINVLHFMAEKAKIYSRFRNGLPKEFDNLVVEYSKPEYSHIDMAFFVNGAKKLVVPLHGNYNPLGDIIKWLESVCVEQCEELFWTFHLDCECGCHLILCYEQLNYFGEEYGHFYAYGSWTYDKKHKEETVSVFCLKRDLIDAIYTPLINLWEGLTCKSKETLRNEGYEWSIIQPDGNCAFLPSDILNIIRSKKIERYLKKQNKSIGKILGFSRDEIDEFRRQLAVCLGIMTDENGRRYYKPDYIRAFTGYSYESLAEVMQYHTPQSWADMITM